MSPTESLYCRWAWRPYQQRVLDAVEHHLGDDRLHIVAAPGSGKTILGIEVFRRLGRPALVLSPTRTIRNQWLYRLQEFLPDDAPWPPPWAGSDLDRPSFFTSVTYQALHVAFPGKNRQTSEDDAEAEEPEALSQDEIGRLLNLFKEAGIGTLILDEAHHLHSAWWKSLDKLVRSLPGLTVVSLTATPPYEVTGAKWRKYSDLCGPIDEEISVPELVRERNLCPHQDFVWVVEAPSVTQRLQAYDASVDDFCARLFEDPVFRLAVQAHPLLGEDVEPVLILDDPELAVALLVFLRETGQELPKRLTSLLDIGEDELPALNRRWWQVLVKAYLYERRWIDVFDRGPHRKEVAGTLRAAGLLRRRELRLVESRPLKTELALSPEKIAGCVQICGVEKEARGESLRQVFLTDFIRDESLDANSSTDLGAWPLFCALTLDAEEEAKRFYGLLTGRLAIIQQGLAESLQGSGGGAGLTFTPLKELPGFARVSDSGRSLTPFFTRLLQDGSLRVLVGTRSLLGEGWDAPVINSLVLASFVGSYMLTNQMRGRAIRIDSNRPDKAASIWHLTSVEPSTPSGFSDIEELKRRFATFVGVRQSGPVIENGLERLDLPWHYRPGTALSRIDPQRNNEEMVRRLGEIEGLGRQWREAIETGGQGRVMPTLRSRGRLPMRFFHLRRTLRLLALEALFLFFAGTFESMQGMRHASLEGGGEFLLALAVAALGGFLLALPKLIKSAMVFFRHLPVDGTVRQIALSLAEALQECGLLPSVKDEPRVLVERQSDGSVTAALADADFFEQALFADSLEEILSAVENPRYFLTRSKRHWRWLRSDFHAVPQVLGADKKKAEAFYRAWKKRVGPAALVYTRSTEGRRFLLRARARAFSTAMAPPAERLDRWQ